MDENIINREYLGQGWYFPLRVNGRGEIDLARGETSIEQAIQTILETQIGERKMRPEFGCQIHELVFAHRDATTAGLAESYVKQALLRWEPRIEVQVVEVSFPSEYAGMMLIEITYEIKSTHDERSIIFPFYLVDEEEL